jgi:hypothetical protein
VILGFFKVLNQSPDLFSDVSLEYNIESFGEATHDPIQEELDEIRRGLLIQTSKNMSIDSATKSLIQEMSQVDDAYALDGLYVFNSELRGYPRSFSYNFDSRYGTVDIKYTVELGNENLNFAAQASFRQIGSTIKFEYMGGDMGLLLGGRIAIKYIDENEFFVIRKDGVRLVQSLYVRG